LFQSVERNSNSGVCGGRCSRIVLPDTRGGREEIFMAADRCRLDMVFKEPVAIKGRLFCSIPDRIPDPLVEKGIKITPLRGFDLR
jgi:hypothetical protein